MQQQVVHVSGSHELPGQARSTHAPYDAAPNPKISSTTFSAMTSVRAAPGCRVSGAREAARCTCA
jgi:hypothetical protein